MFISWYCNKLNGCCITVLFLFIDWFSIFLIFIRHGDDVTTLRFGPEMTTSRVFYLFEKKLGFWGVVALNESSARCDDRVGKTKSKLWRLWIWFKMDKSGQSWSAGLSRGMWTVLRSVHNCALFWLFSLSLVNFEFILVLFSLSHSGYCSRSHLAAFEIEPISQTPIIDEIKDLINQSESRIQVVKTQGS